VAFFKKDHGNFLGIDDLKRIRQPRQESEPHHRELGNAWAFRVGVFQKELSRLHGRIGWVELGFPKDMEIDTLDEFKLCKLIQENWKL
jgi:CMP-N-acetylneuraminic acid synthetase